MLFRKRLRMLQKNMNMYIEGACFMWYAYSEFV